MKKFLIVAALVLPFTSQAQTLDYDLTAPTVVTPPSTNAAAIAKVADVAVSYYTGKPDITMPIYTVQRGQLTVPISLSYDATGIRVEQDASSVGLGWNLAAGGVITRTIMGLPDEMPTRGYFAAANVMAFPDANDPLNTAWLSQVNNCNKLKMATGYFDMTPDVYLLSFNGNSAKMYQDNRGRFYVSPFKAWKITGSIKTGFTIITEDGTTYIFGNNESMGNDVTTNGDNGSYFSGNTAWYLSSMIAPNNTDTISFQYVTQSVDQSPKIKPRSTYDLQYGEPGFACAGVPDSYNLLESTVLIQGTSPVLSSISYKNGRVDFQLVKDRLDIPAQYRVASIVVTDTINGLGTTTRRTVLNQNNTNRTLLLTSLDNIAGRDTLRHSFGYNSIEQLPSQTSTGQDHWGYYNRKGGNSSLIAQFTDAFQVYYDGANREPDSVGTAIGVLNKITYPTGGTTTLDYEINDYSYLGGRSLYNGTTSLRVWTPHEVSANTNRAKGPGEANADIVTFSVKDTQGDTLYYQSRTKRQGDGTFDLYFRDGNGTTLFGFSGTSNGASSRFVTLYPGNTYSFTAVRGYEANPDWGFIHMKIYSWDTVIKPPVFKSTGGGLRIKRITTYDGIDHKNDIIKRFQYLENDSTSSGYMMTEPLYSNFTYRPVYCSPGSLPVKQGDLTYLNRYSSSIVSLGRTQGSTVGYSRVTVFSGEKGENGREEFYFTVKGVNDGNGKYPYPPPTSRDDLRGLLTRHEVYGADGKIKNSLVNNYLYNSDNLDASYKPNFRYFYGTKWGLQRSNNIFDGQGCPTSNGWSFNGVMYNIFQFWPVVGSTVETSYPSTPTGDPVVTTSIFTYDTTNLQVASISKVVSDGSIWLDTLTYPVSYKGNAVYDSLLARHMLTAPIEQKSYRNGMLVSWQKNDYAFFGGLVEPSIVSASVSGNPLEQRIKYLQYDTQGNLLDASKSDDAHTVYLYGYKNTLPVAQVVGSDYAHVSALVNMAVLQNPSSDQAMRTELAKIRTGFSSQNVLVTTYTYANGKGMTSMTDPKGMVTYYEYDSRNRLHVIRDQNQNILKMICYNYWGQPQNCIQAFSSAAQSGSFTRNSCPTGATSSSISYVVAAGKYLSYISQADADAKAIADLNTNGQNQANSVGICTFYSAAQTGTFTKSDCGTNYLPGSVSVTLPAGTSTSTVSQADADYKANAVLQVSGQIQANQTGTCNCDREGYKLINGQCEKGTIENFDKSIGGGKCQSWDQYRFSTGLDATKYHLRTGPC